LHFHFAGLIARIARDFAKDWNFLRSNVTSPRADSHLDPGIRADTG
jgi:hypothetical protein